MPKLTSPRQWERYEQLRKRSWSVTEASREVGIDRTTAWRREKRRQDMNLEDRTETSAARAVPGPIPLDELNDQAAMALEDFGFFQQRYFGRIATPWQKEAAEEVVRLLESPDKEFAVVNAPPGVGKSTVFTLDIPAWLTCRNRAIRGQIGSKTEGSARRYVRRLRRALERTVPLVGESSEVQRGLALDAVATLADDYGSFKPENRDIWAADAFVVAQHGNVLIEEKEPTWSSYGMDSGFLGMRYDFIVWDDLIDKLVLRTVESRENWKEWWDDQAETRLEPAGLLCLQGQRMGPDDGYRYCLDKQLVPEDEEDEEPGEVERPQMYHHIVFKAHYEDRCVGNHRKGKALYYPEGCLLDPRRASWNELRMKMANPRHNFAVIYQQEDTDPESVLVDPLWISGGTDPHTGEVFPGCVDKERGLCQLQPGLHGSLLSVATADPSPTKYWSIQWWVVRFADGQPQERYLMDQIRKPMDAPSFLDWNDATRSFTGVMEEWQRRSNQLGLPITTWIVEKNGAQNFMLQYEHVRRWMGHWRVRLIPHSTHTNKSDQEYGVQTLKGVYRHGLVRLPGTKGQTFNAVQWLVSEVTHYSLTDKGGWKSDDCVMAQWFLEFNLPKLAPRVGPMKKLPRPSWLRDTDTWRRKPPPAA